MRYNDHPALLAAPGDTTSLQIINRGPRYTFGVDLKTVDGALISTLNVQYSRLLSDRNFYTVQVPIPREQGYYQLFVTGLDTPLYSQIICVHNDNANLCQLTYYNSYNDQDINFEIKPVFSIRIPGGFLMNSYYPESQDTVFQNQTTDFVLLSSRPIDTWNFSAGDAKGIPDNIQMIMNRVWACDNVYVDGKRYVKYLESAWEESREDGVPTRAWKLRVVEVEGQDSGSLESYISLSYSNFLCRKLQQGEQTSATYKAADTAMLQYRDEGYINTSAKAANGMILIVGSDGIYSSNGANLQKIAQSPNVPEDYVRPYSVFYNPHLDMFYVTYWGDVSQPPETKGYLFTVDPATLAVTEIPGYPERLPSGQVDRIEINYAFPTTTGMIFAYGYTLTQLTGTTWNILYRSATGKVRAPVVHPGSGNMFFTEMLTDGSESGTNTGTYKYMTGLAVTDTGVPCTNRALILSNDSHVLFSDLTLLRTYGVRSNGRDMFKILDIPVIGDVSMKIPVLNGVSYVAEQMTALHSPSVQRLFSYAGGELSPVASFEPASGVGSVMKNDTLGGGGIAVYNNEIFVPGGNNRNVKHIKNGVVGTTEIQCSVLYHGNTSALFGVSRPAAGRIKQAITIDTQSEDPDYQNTGMAAATTLTATLLGSGASSAPITINILNALGDIPALTEIEYQTLPEDELEARISYILDYISAQLGSTDLRVSGDQYLILSDACRVDSPGAGYVFEISQSSVQLPAVGGSALIAVTSTLNGGAAAWEISSVSDFIDAVIQTGGVRINVTGSDSEAEGTVVLVQRRVNEPDNYKTITVVKLGSQLYSTWASEICRLV